MPQLSERGADAILSGAEPIYIPLVPPNYDFDISLIEEGFKQGAKAIIICNPSNPCGKVFTAEDLYREASVFPGRTGSHWTEAQRASGNLCCTD